MSLLRPRALRMALALALIASSLLAAGDASAQTDPNIQRGFAPDKAYAFGELDSVNLFNGNLTLTLPLGGTYPTAETLGLGLVLTYNSNVWDLESVTRRVNGLDASYTQALPSRESNAGLGWSVSLGKLYPPGTHGSSHWRFLGPDGGEHVFYTSLHIGETADTNVFYSRDGSYLRLKLSNIVTEGGTTAPLTAEVELPDGRIQRFVRTSVFLPFRLAIIRDLHGNQWAITYNVANQWQISDTKRTLYVNFTTRANGDVVVSNVDLPGFGGTRSVYTFAYTDTTISRSCLDDDPEVHGGTPSTAAVTFLSAVEAWDGSRFTFDSYNTTCQDGATTIENLPGTLAQMTLPTLGKLAWTYQNYQFAGRGPGCGQSRPFLSATKVAGVKTKRVLNAAGTCETWDGIGCQWTYAPARIGVGRLKNTVTQPTGDQVVSFFSDAVATSTATWTGWEYGLPFDSGQTDGDNRFLSQEVYDGATKVRSTYVRYEHDRLPSTVCYPNEWYDTNRRVVSEKTVYHDDGDRYAEVTRSDFDGLGHYRQTTTSGNFGAGDVRSSFSELNPERGTYLLNASNLEVGGFTKWPTARNWVLGTAQSASVTEGGQTAKSDFCYAGAGLNTMTGQLLRKRVMRGTSPGANDLVTSYVYSGGNLTEERSYGGDVQSLGTTADLCALPLSAEQFFVKHTHQAGARATSRWQTAAGANLAGGTVLDQTLDANTALPSSVRDVAGVQTNLLYDPMGRLTWERPTTGNGAWTQYQWTRATTSSALANVQVFERPNGSTTGLLAQSRIYFDAHGRPWRDQVLGADGTWSTVDTVWNSLGWKRSVTERQPVSPTKWTTFKDFDPFGRPGTIQPPDGTAHNVTLSYAGVRVVSRTVSVKTGASETPATTTEQYDRQGRLWKVTEPSGAAGANFITTYGYDVGGRLVSVSATGQSRSFSYDNRGFLAWERHPEKGASGNGYVRYLGYDALGNPGRKLDAVATSGGTSGAASDLTFTYDRASRLAEVRETGGAQRTLKAFTYGSGNSGSDKRQGKVVFADRYNYVLIGTTPFTVQVRETYTYAGTAGAVSSRATQAYVNGGAQEGFTQAWTWNDLGDAATVSYPRCTQTGCTGAAATSRNVSFGYTHGYLTSVPGFASSITYHPNGLPYQVVHANNVTWTQAVDPNGMRRPASFSTSGAGTNWTSGTYAYDGAGNVTAIGGSSFTYDPVSRLTAASVATHTNGTSTLKSQSAAYDAFGNITTLTTNGSALQTPTATATNRLNGATFDSMGSMTSWNGNTYEYDAFGMAWRVTSSGIPYVHIYTADEERVWTYQSGAPSRWTLRDLDGKVLREFKNDAGAWSVERDYVHRDGAPLAAVTPTETTYLHPDHLGTPRLITGTAGAYRAFHAYYPYGGEATSPSQDTERMKFTGHERDLGVAGSTADDLDYMHARFYNMQVGRFSSVDPVLGRPASPLTWNRYSYSNNNPVRFIDPTGQLTGSAMAEAAEGAIRELKDELMYGLSDGSLFGLVLSTVAGAALDGAAGAVDVLRVGESLGDAVGSGAGGLEIAGAAVGDGLRAAAIAAPVAGAGRAALAGGGRAALRREAAKNLSGAAQLGRAGEDAVRRVWDIGIKKAIYINGRKRIPDGWRVGVVSEVKNVQSLSYTSQLRDYVSYARQKGWEFHLYVRPTTRLSSPLQQQVASGAITLRNIP